MIFYCVYYSLFFQEVSGENVPQDAKSFMTKATHEERQHIVNFAKIGVRNRRGRRMQAS